MQDRIKELRKALGLTQQKFAEKIGVRRNTVAQYEIGRNQPLEPVVTSICREFHVNEVWLRTGEGEMFKAETRDEELASFFGEVLAKESGDFRQRLLLVMSRLSEEQWALLEQIAQDLAKETQKADPE